MRVQRILLGLAAVTIGIAGLVDGPARAQPTGCTVQTVAWSTAFGGTLEITCGNVFHFAYGPTISGACTAASLEARKSWQGMAQAALLSGRSLVVEFQMCTAPSGNSERRLTSVRLN